MDRVFSMSMYHSREHLYKDKSEYYEQEYQRLRDELEQVKKEKYEVWSLFEQEQKRAEQAERERDAYLLKWGECDNAKRFFEESLATERKALELACERMEGMEESTYIEPDYFRKKAQDR